MLRLIVATILGLLLGSSLSAGDDERPLKVFLLAGQSNMVGWGNSLELPESMRTGNDRVLMFEDGRWQPLRPHERPKPGQAHFGLTESTFGPEIGFAHELANAWPEETIGIVKHAVGGTSLLAWKPDWSKQDADRVGQGALGPLYRQLIRKFEEARGSREIELLGCLWLQGGGDAKRLDTAEEYRENLEALVAAIRKDTGVDELPFLYAWRRPSDIPDDLTGFVPAQMDSRHRFAQWVMKAQWEAQHTIPHSHLILLRDIETYPMNVHYNTSGQLDVGGRFAQRFLELSKPEAGE